MDRFRVEAPQWLPRENGFRWAGTGLHRNFNFGVRGNKQSTRNLAQGTESLGKVGQVHLRSVYGNPCWDNSIAQASKNLSGVLLHDYTTPMMERKFNLV